jgi:hypothetical protein
MAKTLEEHLYRSAKSKADYMDASTLKARLQQIAHGLDLDRSMPSNQDTFVNPQHESTTRPEAHLAAQLPLPQQPNGAQTAVGTSSNMLQRQGMQGSQPGSVAQQNAVWSSSDVGSGIATHLLPSGGQYVQGQVQSQDTGLPVNQGQTSVGNVGDGQSIQWPTAADYADLASTRNFAPQEIARTGDVAQCSLSPNLNETVAPQGLENELSLHGSLSQFSTMEGATDSSNITGDIQDGTQEAKVILHQQQRLLLLRHASKCRIGPSCTTKFCAQMITLWNHMKECRNKSCTTSHCRSSRCVLNHYRICKNQRKTSTCKVCGPVMERIKEQEKEAVFGDMSGKDQSAPLQMQSEHSQLRELHAQQEKLREQLENLKQLQRKKEMLLFQQRALQEQAQSISDLSSPEAEQLRQKQALLQSLQLRCQQEQFLLQQKIQLQSASPGDISFAQTGQISNSQAEQIGVSPHQVSFPSTLSDTANPAPFDAMPMFLSSSASQTHVDSLVSSQTSPYISSLRPPSRQTSQMGTLEPDKHLVRQTVASKGKRLASKGKRAGALKGKALILAGQGMPPSEHSIESNEQVVAEATLSQDAEPAGDIENPDNMSLMSVMTTDMISKHLESLNKHIHMSSRTVTYKCLPLVQDLIDDQYGWVFKDPVDPVALGLPDYFDVVKTPMHLELVKKKLENAIYPDMHGCARDVRLVFENAILYNGEGSEVGRLAQSMLNQFAKAFVEVMKGKFPTTAQHLTMYFSIPYRFVLVTLGIESAQQILESNGQACSLCGTQRRLFEPNVLYCRGNCQTQRISWEATYYTDRQKQNHWCDACYEVLSSDDPIALDDGSEIHKRDLQVSKNDAVPEEPWVQCDNCHAWVHQVCALFNGRTNKSSASFLCPNCHLKRSNRESSISAAQQVVKGAEELSPCKMSIAIENGLKESLEAVYCLKARELGIDYDAVEKVNGLCVRVVSNVEKKHVVGPEVSNKSFSNQTWMTKQANIKVFLRCQSCGGATERK